MSITKQTRIDNIIDVLRVSAVELQTIGVDLDEDAAEKVWDVLADITDAIETLLEIEFIKSLKA